jgi:cytochrome b subunit of formate dehydrogenase
MLSQIIIIIIIIITGWIMWGSNPGRGKIFLFSQKRLEQLWVSPSLVLNA